MWAGVSRERRGVVCLGVEGERTGSPRERGDVGARMECAATKNSEEQRPHGRSGPGPGLREARHRGLILAGGAVGTAAVALRLEVWFGGGTAVLEDTSGLREG